MKRILLLLLCATAAHAATADVKLTRLGDRVRVEIGGSLFTEYIFAGASRPYCYPVLAADGTPLTRDFPMKATAGEETDHPHHRALMFAHGDANQVDFWDEGTSGNKFPKGLTVHDGLLETTGGATGVLRARNRWTAPDGRLIATDETTLRFRGTADTRELDYEITIHALPDAPLVLGDSKEGTMAIRVAQWLTLPHKVAGKDVPGAGHFLSSTGMRDDAVWGKRADWCDLYAPRGDKTYGVAIFDHPQNAHHPTWWMARGYGLFGANPFGQSEFESTKEKPLTPGLGSHTIPAGGSLTLRYRFLFHLGDPGSARIADHYAAYAAGE
jgi:hypothetical protein